MPVILGILSRLAHVVKVRHQTLLDLKDPDDIVYYEPRVPVELVRITADNVGLVEAWRGKQIADMFRGFVEDRQCGVLALHNGEVIGHLWTVICHPGEGRRLASGYLELLEGESMLHFGRVDPAYQGKAVFQAILAFAARCTLVDDGAQRIIADPPAKNVPSRKAIEKIGYKRYGHGWYIQIGHKLVYSKEYYDDTPAGAVAKARRTTRTTRGTDAAPTSH